MAWSGEVDFNWPRSPTRMTIQIPRPRTVLQASGFTMALATTGTSPPVYTMLSLHRYLWPCFPIESLLTTCTTVRPMNG